MVRDEYVPERGDVVWITLNPQAKPGDEKHRYSRATDPHRPACTSAVQADRPQGLARRPHVCQDQGKAQRFVEECLTPRFGQRQAENVHDPQDHSQDQEHERNAEGVRHRQTEHTAFPNVTVNHRSLLDLPATLSPHTRHAGISLSLLLHRAPGCPWPK